MQLSDYSFTTLVITSACFTETMSAQRAFQSVSRCNGSRLASPNASRQRVSRETPPCSGATRFAAVPDAVRRDVNLESMRGGAPRCCTLAKSCCLPERKFDTSGSTSGPLSSVAVSTQRRKLCLLRTRALVHDVAIAGPMHGSESALAAVATGHMLTASCAQEHAPSCFLSWWLL